jgi:cysteinyl-tRNA synthetase
MDFVLWKPSAGDQPGWESPWGYGRPGWHIECSAMAKDILGDTFDIHGGGNDLMFPHHENEIAQSCCASGHDHDGEGFANYWLHNEMLQVEGKKMSKSLGNFFTVRDLLDQGVSGEVIRFVFLSTHYRKPMDWTKEKAVEAERTLKSFANVIFEVQATEVDEGVVDAVASDLNTSLAITRLRQLAKSKEAGRLRASLDFLGFDLSRQLKTIERMKTESSGWTGAYHGHEQRTVSEERLISDVLTKLEMFRAEKNWGDADALKAALADAGVKILRFQQSGAPTYEVEEQFDASKLEGLL